MVNGVPRADAANKIQVLARRDTNTLVTDTTPRFKNACKRPAKAGSLIGARSQMKAIRP